MKLTKKQKILGLTTLIVLSFVTTTKIATYLKQEKIKTALEYGQLAKLPENSSNICVETKGSLFSRTFWLTFESNHSEIKIWLNKSKELKKIVKLDFEKLKENSLFKKITKYKRSNDPNWFLPNPASEYVEIFEVSIPEKALFGKVWVNWKINKVYIETSYS